VTLAPPDDEAIERCWNAFLATRSYEAFRFGNTREMADEPAPQVRDGVKTTTSALLWSFEAEGQPLPFDQVDERFARDYGVGDRTLVWSTSRAITV
jgi:uncharacterized protein YhfF